MDEIIVSVVTPTYNRCTNLKDLYNSLAKQTDLRFEWIVIDDGSTDQTESLIKAFQKEHILNILYYKKSNHGKHTALNESHKFIRGCFVVVVDSDDTLTRDAIETIISTWDKYKTNTNIVGITFQRKFKNDRVSDSSIKGEYISTMEEEFHNGFVGDHCETFKAEIFKSKDFPVFDNERFMAEGTLWYLLSKDKEIVYSDKAIYVFEYLQDGLTKNIRKIMSKNPQGAYWNALQIINSNFGFKMRLKNGILAIYYGKLAKKKFNQIKKDINNSGIFALSFFPYLLVSVLWKKYINS